MKLLLIRLLALACLVAAFVAISDAATIDEMSTQDPNHPGISRTGGVVVWKSVSTQCQPCAGLAKRYNAVMDELLTLRWKRATMAEHYKRYRDEIQRRYPVPTKDPKATKEQKQTAEDYAAVRDKMATMDIMNLSDTYDRYNAFLNSQISSFEAQGAYLRNALSRCEKQCVQKPQGTGITTGGQPPRPPETPPLPPAVPGSLALDFPWKGPYPAVCHRCALLAKRLNELPGLARERKIQIRKAKNVIEQVHYNVRMDRLRHIDRDPRWSDPEGAIKVQQDQIDKWTRELATIKRNFEETLALYQPCIKACPKTAKGKCPVPPADKAVKVGSNAEVGSGARVKEKVKEAVAGAVGGLLGGVLGGGGGGGGFGLPPGVGGGGGDRKPETQNDPIGKDQKTVAQRGGVELATGARFTPDGLLVSSRINSAPGSGTFQAVFLEDGQGRRIAAYKYVIFELWGEWELTVSWTYDRWVDGQHVEHREGGWVESWREKLGTLAFLIAEKAKEAGIWHRLGFNNASHGVQSLGSYFKVAKKDLQNGPVNLIVHVTLPEADPVTTVPLVYELAMKPGSENEVLVKAASQTLAEKRDCYKTAVTR